MKAGNPGAHLWLTAEQELLLRAALLPAPESLRSWEAWRARADVEALDKGSHRLLPLLYTNLKSQGVEHALLQRYKSVYRYTWYRNRMIERATAALLRVLQTAQIPTLVLKGLALTALHYGDYGLRPMDDIDLLVPAARARAAIDLLLSVGWQAKWQERLTDAVVFSKRGTGFLRPGAFELDLHWHVLVEDWSDASDDDYWQKAQPLSLEGANTLALSPAHQLLHVCLHGAEPNVIPPLRWVPDSMAVLKTAQVDWDDLLAQARKRQVARPLHAALVYLRGALHAPIPESALAGLAAAPQSVAMRFETALKARKEGFWEHVVSLWLRHRRYLRFTSRTRLGLRPVSFLRFLQDVWAIKAAWQVPLYMVYWELAKFRRLLAR